MLKIRATFAKFGRIKFISHLDLNRCMLRVFRRSKLPILYTNGCHPHPYYSFALALSLGFESECEIMDFNITDDDISMSEICDRLNSVMPEGITIVKVALQKKKITEITQAEYDCSIITDSSNEVYDVVQKILSQSEIIIEKKTKKGIITVDIKPQIEIMSCAFKNISIEMKLRMPAGTKKNYNPNLFVNFIKKYCSLKINAVTIKRKAILCENNEIFS